MTTAIKKQTTNKSAGSKTEMAALRFSAPDVTFLRLRGVWEAEFLHRCQSISHLPAAFTEATGERSLIA
jgi:hypothetical protein